MKIVVSLTTSPRRIIYLKNTINSILNQTVPPSKIIINIPDIFERTGETYFIPNWLLEIKEVHINYCKKDLGPITKLVPTINLYYRKFYKDLYIITIDDDIYYPSNMIESYIQFLNDNPLIFACGISGFNFVSNRIIPVLKQQSVHVLEAYASVIYNISIFEKESFNHYLNEALSDLNCKYSDDFIISNYLGLRNIIRLNLVLPEFNRDVFINKGSILSYGLQSDALHKGGCNFTPSTNEVRYRNSSLFLESKNLLSI